MPFGGLVNEFNYMGTIWDTLKQIVCDQIRRSLTITAMTHSRVNWPKILFWRIKILFRTVVVYWKGNRSMQDNGTRQGIQCSSRWTKYSQSSSGISNLATSGDIGRGRRGSPRHIALLLCHMTSAYSSSMKTILRSQITFHFWSKYRSVKVISLSKVNDRNWTMSTFYLLAYLQMSVLFSFS